MVVSDLDQDWVLLRSICTPNVQWLYSDLNPAFEDKQLTAEEYVAEMSAQHGLGDSRSKIPLSSISLPIIDFRQSLGNIFQGLWCLKRPNLMVHIT